MILKNALYIQQLADMWPGIQNEFPLPRVFQWHKCTNMEERHMPEIHEILACSTTGISHPEPNGWVCYLYPQRREFCEERAQDKLLVWGQTTLEITAQPCHHLRWQGARVCWRKQRGQGDPNLHSLIPREGPEDICMSLAKGHSRVSWTATFSVCARAAITKLYVDDLTAINSSSLFKSHIRTRIKGP